MARSPLVGVAAIGLLLGGITLLGLTLIADGGPHKAASHGRALAGGSAAGSVAGSASGSGSYLSHMPDGIFAACGTLALGALIMQVFRGVPIPYTVILLALGMAFGGLLLLTSTHDGGGEWEGLLLLAQNAFLLMSQIDAHLMLNIFLPPLVTLPRVRTDCGGVRSIVFVVCGSRGTPGGRTGTCRAGSWPPSSGSGAASGILSRCGGS